jgi:hypothetical protein
MLFVAFTTMAQEKYYSRLKTVTKVSGKIKTEVSTISITIDEEYKIVSVSMDEVTRYSIVEVTTDSLSGKKTAKLKLKFGTGLLEAAVIYDEYKAILNNTQNGKPTIFDLRVRPNISID